MFCLDAIHFVALLACLLSPCSQRVNSSSCTRYKKVKTVSILSKDPDGKNTTEKFWLVLVVIKMSPLRQFCSYARLSSTPQLFYADPSIGPQHNSLETGSENRFHFPLLRLIHWFYCGKSSKMHVQRELNLLCAICCVQLCVLRPKLTCCSVSHSHLPLLQLRGSAWNLISCMTLHWGRVW